MRLCVNCLHDLRYCTHADSKQAKRLILRDVHVRVHDGVSVRSADMIQIPGYFGICSNFYEGIDVRSPVSWNVIILKVLLVMETSRPR